MRSVRGVFVAAALVAAFGLGAVLSPNGRTWAEEKKDGGSEAPKRTPAQEAADRYVEDVTTASNLIEYGRREKQPVALLAAAQMLSRIGIPDKQLEAEGASTTEKAPDRAKQLNDLIIEARKLGGDSKLIMDLAKEVEDDVKDKLKEDSGSKGTPSKGTKWEGVIDPINEKTDKPKVTIKRDFIGKQIGKITITKLVNVGVPLSVKVYDPKGTEVPHNVGDAMSYAFIPPKDGVYTIEIRNKHNRGVAARVNTN